jgi:hypothetical protein
MSNLKVFKETDFYTLEQLQAMSLAELEGKTTLEEGYTSDLKLEGMLIRQDGFLQYSNQFKLWLTRTGIDDGEWCDNKVSLDILDKNTNKWVILEEWEAPEFPF